MSDEPGQDITNTGSPNMLLHAADETDSYLSLISTYLPNPCFKVSGKPFSSKPLIAVQTNGAIVPIEYEAPHESHKKVTQKKYNSIEQFMKEQNISDNGTDCK